MGIKDKQSQLLSERFYQYPLQIKQESAMKLTHSKEALLDKARKHV